MTANSEMIFSQISETGSRLYRELCMNLPASAEIPALLTELCRTAAECEYAEVWQLDSQKGELKKLSPGGTAGMTVKAAAGLMGKAMRDRQPAAGSSDEYKGYPAVTFRSVLAMPLFSDGGEVTGVLRLCTIHDVLGIKCNLSSIFSGTALQSAKTPDTFSR